MQCFKFLKVMMILFNLLIFVSMEVVGFLGFLTKAGHSLIEPRLENGKLCTQTLPCKFSYMRRKQRVFLNPDS